MTRIGGEAESGAAARNAVWRPLTATQRRFWAARRLHPDRPVDNRFMKLDWALPLDPWAFNRALTALVERTDAMRLVFEEDADGAPRQRALARLDPELEIRDLSAEPDPEAAADRWLDGLAALPIDLSRRPFRTALARLGPERWIWLLCFHHIVTDRASNEALVARLSALYGEALAGPIAPAPPAPGFLDLAAPPPRPAAVDAPRPPVVRLHGAEGTETRMIPLRLRLGAERLARAQAALGLRSGLLGSRGLPLLFNLLAAAAAIHAVRVSGVRAVTLGAPTHGRYAPEAEGVAGPFMQVLPLAVEIPEGARVADVLAAVKAERRRVFAAARAGRPPAPAPYGVTMNFIATPMPDFHGVASVERPSAVAPDSGGVDLALTVRAAEIPGDVLIRFAVNAAVAEIEPAESVAATFLRVLDAVIDAPEAEIDRIALLGPDAAAAAAAATEAAFAAPPPAHPTLVAGLAAAAERRPDAPALIEGDRRLSHAALRDRAEAAAGALARRGIGRGDVLPVIGARRAELVVALMAAARSGAAFCPLDPAVPPERLAAILRLTRAKALLVADDAAGPPVAGVPALPLAALEAEGGASPPPPRPEDPAYVMFTSGSTGEPKGVVVPHRSFMHYMDWLRDALGGAPVEWAFTSSIGFEGALRLFVGLVSGGAVHVYADRGAAGLALVDALRADAAEAVFATPSHLRMALPALRPVSRLRVLATVGEVLDAALARRVQEALGGEIEIQNWYGPVEGTMSSTFHRFDAERDRAATVPVGRAGGAAVAHVLDAGMNPLPRGVTGEIWLGGARLSDGYLGRPDLTRAAFRPDPFRPGARLYRTGDLGVLNPDGEIVHRGRIDDQVKIHGVRVELAEVEAALAAHPDVSACAVRREAGPPERLVAWVVGPRAPDAAALRAFLARRLPEATIPAAFVPVAALPLSPNGKVDRRALPAPTAPASAAAAAPMPDDPTLAAVLEICRRHLGTDAVAPDDPLQSHGADSLTSVQIILEAEARFGVSFAATALGGALTPASLAARLDAARLDAAAAVASPPEPTGGAPALPRGFGALAAPVAAAPAEASPLERVARFAASWPGEPCDTHGILRRLTSGGDRPPLYWCFNHASEAAALAAALGPERPLFALRSLVGAYETRAERRRHERALAEHCADAILAAHPGGPILLGGNCQAGRVAMQTARRLLWLGAEAPQVCVLDGAPALPFPGRVALIFGDRSRRQNPFKHHRRPELGWRRLYGEVTWDEIPGRHGAFFEPPSLAPLVETLARRLGEAEAFAPFPLPAADRRVAIAGPAEIAPFAAGERRTLRVELRNAGTRLWRETAFSALHLVARWRRADGGLARLRAGATPLEAPLPPGETASLEIAVRAPRLAGPMRLEFDMAEAGFARLSDGDIPPLSIPVEIEPAARTAPRRRRGRDRPVA